MKKMNECVSMAFLPYLLVYMFICFEVGGCVTLEKF